MSIISDLIENIEANGAWGSVSKILSGWIIKLLIATGSIIGGTVAKEYVNRDPAEELLKDVEQVILDFFPAQPMQRDAWAEMFLYYNDNELRGRKVGLYTLGVRSVVSTTFVDTGLNPYDDFLKSHLNSTAPRSSVHTFENTDPNSPLTELWNENGIKGGKSTSPLWIERQIGGVTYKEVVGYVGVSFVKPNTVLLKHPSGVGLRTVNIGDHSVQKKAISENLADKINEVLAKDPDAIPRKIPEF